MALCESQLDPRELLHTVKMESDSGSENVSESPEKQLVARPVASPSLAVPLTVDYRSARSHFVPPEVELYAQSTPARPLTPARTLTPSSYESGSTTSLSTIGSNTSGVPPKRKRGRPRVDKSSPEYIAKSAARKQAREMAAMMNSSGEIMEKRKRGRPRVDKTSPEYLARKRAKELEALQKKTRQFKRHATGAKGLTKMPTRSLNNKPTNSKTRIANNVKARIANSAKTKATSNTKTKVLVKKIVKTPKKIVANKSRIKKLVTKDRKVVVRRTAKFVRRARKKESGASSSTGETTPRVKRKYTRRAPPAGQPSSTDTAKKRGRKKKLLLGPDGHPLPSQPAAEKPKGRRGRHQKSEPGAGLPAPANHAPKRPKEPRLHVRKDLIPVNSEPIPVDSDDEPNLGSPSQASDSLSLDENLRALRHLHEKYANIGKDELYEAHLLTAHFKKPDPGRLTDGAVDDDVVSVRSSSSTKEPKVEKLEDSSNSDSDSSSSGSGSSSSGSSSSSNSGSSSSESSSDEESEAGKNGTEPLSSEKRVGRSPHTSDREDDRSFGAWSRKTGSGSDSNSESEAERVQPRCDEPSASLSESENESPDKSFQCTVCHKWYSTIVTLKIHKRVHLNRSSGNSRSRCRATDRYECDCCLEVFTRREKLWEHKAEAHRGAMTVRCEVCRRCFEDDAELAAHDRTHTADERAGRCSDCGASYPRYEQLRRHRACAHPPPAPPRAPHACPQCGKGFGHAHSLTRHLHNHAKQLYRCVVCKASFARADQLAQHLNSHLASYRRLKP